MKRIFISIIFFSAIMAFVLSVGNRDALLPMSRSMMSLGFTLIVGYLIGLVVQKFSLPKITGYLLAGIIAGPYLFNLLSGPVVVELQLIDKIALSLIALTAGGEFRYSEVKHQLKLINSVIFFQTILIISVFVLFLIIFHPYIGFLSGQSLMAVIGAGLIIGAISTAKSPATTIAVITETNARGPFTDFVLGVTVLKDVVVVLVFSVALALAKPLILGNEELQVGYIFVVLRELGVSIVLGLITGALIVLYLKYVDQQRTLFLLAFMILGIELAKQVHAEVVLIFMVAGFFVQNFSNAGGKLIEGIKQSSLPIYVVFFVIAGASLNFKIFLENWIFALMVVALRMYLTYQSTWIGGRLNNSDYLIKNYRWMGFIGQAGLSLGLSALVVENIPGPIGVSIRTLIISTIAINQIAGPVLFRYALEKAGDIPDKKKP